MTKRSNSNNGGARSRDPWLYMGLRLRDRRIQLGLSEAAVAERVAVPLPYYEAFEAGQAQVPAVLLAQLAGLFKVPVFYFFQDVFSAANKASASQPEPAAILATATDEERVAALVGDFQRTNRVGQQCLLLLARALAQDTEKARPPVGSTRGRARRPRRGARGRGEAGKRRQT
jgi:transcriptional regulator with XRE-family HTH domain